MRAIQLHRYGGPEVLELCEIARPEPAAGQVLLRVRAAAVNPADGKWRDGMFAQLTPDALPMVPGYDVAGEVESTASEAFPKGTRIAAMLDAVAKGAYAEYAVVAESALARIPEGMSYEQAAAAPTACLTGLQMVERAANVQAGDRVLVTGALGMVGRTAMHFALAKGAQVVAAVRPAKAQAALDAGAQDAIAIGEETPAGTQFDHVIDTVGGAQVAQLCRALKPGGTIITAATTPIPPEGLPAEPQFYAVASDGADLARILAEIDNGTLPVPIEATLPLEQASQAQALVDGGGRSGKIILTT